MAEDQLTCEIQIVSNNYPPDQNNPTIKQFRQELVDVGVTSADLKKDMEELVGTKSLDPVVLGALIVTLSPALLTKFLDFLHAWAMRREGRIIKLKLQSKTGDMLELEVPITMDQTEVAEWMNMVRTALDSYNKPIRKKS